jgi:hypothetical protein
MTLCSSRYSDSSAVKSDNNNHPSKSIVRDGSSNLSSFDRAESVTLGVGEVRKNAQVEKETSRERESRSKALLENIHGYKLLPPVQARKRLFIIYLSPERESIRNTQTSFLAPMAVKLELEFLLVDTVFIIHNLWTVWFINNRKPSTSVVLIS